MLEQKRDFSMLSLYFAPHDEKVLTTKTFTSLFSVTHIFVIENAVKGRIRETECYWNLLSHAALTPDDLDRITQDGFSPFGMKLAETVYGSRKLIRFERSLLCRGDDARAERLLGSIGQLRNMNLEKALRELRARLSVYAGYHGKRDENFARQLEKLCTENFGKSILVIRGEAHQLALEKFLKRTAVPFTSFHPYEPWHPNLVTCMISKLQAGETPDQKETMTALATSIMCEEMEKNSKFPIPLESLVSTVESTLQGMTDADLESYLRIKLNNTAEIGEGRHSVPVPRQGSV